MTRLRIIRNTQGDTATLMEEGELDPLFKSLVDSFIRRGMPGKYAASETTPVSEVPKVSQIKANYKPAFCSARCGACAHYREHACELVEGNIEPSDVCDLFTPQQKT